MPCVTHAAMLVPAAPDHLPWIREVLRDGARDGAFEPELAHEGLASDLFFANLSRAVQAGVFMAEDASGRIGDVPCAGYVGLDEEAPHAALGFVFFKALPGDFFELWLMATAPAARRRGVARAMLRAALDTPAGRLAHVARVNTTSLWAPSMGRVLLDVGYRRERTGRGLDWYVHGRAPEDLAGFVRHGPAGGG